jgi:hypothetical protein
VKNSQSSANASQNTKNKSNRTGIKNKSKPGNQIGGAHGNYPWVALAWWSGWTGKVEGAGHGSIKEKTI